MKEENIKKLAMVLMAAGFLGIGTTTAYFTAWDKTVNQVAVGHNTTEITEEFPTPSPEPVRDNPEYVKKVRVSNYPYNEAGYNADCYVRVMLSFSNSDIGRAVILKGLDTVNWVYNAAEDCYYYKHVLAEGKSTTPLFTGFVIDSAKVDDTYKDSLSDFTISVYEESVQSGSFKDYQSAWNYYLNPVV